MSTMAINPAVVGSESISQGLNKDATDVEEGLHKQIEIERQVSACSTAYTQSPAGASPWPSPVSCHSTPFQLEPMDEAGSSEQFSEEEDEEELFSPRLLPPTKEAPPLWQDCREAPRLCAGMPPLQSELGKWARWAVAAEEGAPLLQSELGQWAKCTVAVEEGAPLLQSELGQWANCTVAAEEGAPLLQSELGQWANCTVAVEEGAPLLQSELGQWANCTVAVEEGAPLLQSELGQWAKCTVAAEDASALWQDCREAPRLCAGMPLLQSELGKWARWTVAAEELQSSVKPMDEWQSSLAPLAEGGDTDESAEESTEAGDESEAEGVPLWQDCREAPRLCAGMPPLQSELGQWAKWAVAAEEWQSPLAPLTEGGDTDESADEFSEAGDESEAEGVPCTLASPPPLWQDCREPAHICLGMPPFQSDLGKWAQWAVAAEEWQSAVLGEPAQYSEQFSEEEEEELEADADALPGLGVQEDCREVPRLCAGMPALQSELGQWAKWAVAAEEWQSSLAPLAEGGDPSSSDEE